MDYWKNVPGIDEQSQQKLNAAAKKNLLVAWNKLASAANTLDDEDKVREILDLQAKVAKLNQSIK